MEITHVQDGRQRVCGRLLNVNKHVGLMFMDVVTRLDDPRLIAVDRKKKTKEGGNTDTIEKMKQEIHERHRRCFVLNKYQIGGRHRA